jgi:hypothetical protein
MARYIDADKLLEQVTRKKSEVAQKRYTDGFNDAIMRARSMIHSAPTIDVALKAEVVNEIIKALADFANDKERHKRINGTNMWHIDEGDVALGIMEFIAELRKKCESDHVSRNE